MSQYLDRFVDGVLMFVEDAGALLPAFVIVEGAGAVTGTTCTYSICNICLLLWFNLKSWG